LQVSLWPGDDEVAPSTLLSTVSRARVALGEDRQGLPHLPDANAGCYHLRSGVGCDWRRFRDLTARARHAPEAEATDLLREALGLVRGAPFAYPPKGAYGWALAELVSMMEVAVVETAERLAELALTAGDAKLTTWAARQGLLVCPGREALYQLLMRAADLAGDPEGVEAAWREVRRAVRAIDRLEEPRSDTIDLYESLVRRQRQKPSPDGHLRAAGNQGG
jgi:DNA-binding SARP family transcriptional activator